MRTIVIGASGFVGKNIMRAISLESEVIGTKNSSTSNVSSSLIKYDLSKDSFKEKFGKYFWDKQSNSNKFYGIIAAAVRQMEKVQDDKAEKLNVDRTIELIKEMVDLNVKPVFISTCYVYPDTPKKYNENDEIGPTSEYARQKSLVEKYLIENVEDYTIYRIDKIVDEFPENDHMFNQWYDNIKQGKDILCIKNQYFTPIFVQDVANAIAIGCKLDLKGVYNLSNNQPIHRTVLAKKFLKHMNVTNLQVLEKTLEELKLSSRPMSTNIDSAKFLNATKNTGFKFRSMDYVMEQFAKHVNSIEKYKDGNYTK